MLSEREVLEFCNKVRKAGGADMLDSLLPGIPHDGRACLIANNLNFDCQITPEEGIPQGHTNKDAWLMMLTSLPSGSRLEDDPDMGELAIKISEATGMMVKEASQNFASLRLDPDMAEVACQFDLTWEEAASRYTEVQQAKWNEDTEAVVEAEIAFNEWKDNLEAPWLLSLSEGSLGEA